MSAVDTYYRPRLQLKRSNGPKIFATTVVPCHGSKPRAHKNLNVVLQLRLLFLKYFFIMASRHLKGCVKSLGAYTATCVSTAVSIYRILGRPHYCLRGDRLWRWLSCVQDSAEAALPIINYLQHLIRASKQARRVCVWPILWKSRSA